MSAWIDQIFQSQIAKRGGIVRRSKRIVSRLGLLPTLIQEVKKRGYHLIEHGDQYIIFCDQAQVKLIC